MASRAAYRRQLVFISITALVALSAVGALTMLRFFANQPPNLGARSGRLNPCPDTPNCVSSQASDKEHAIEPIRFSGPAPEAMERLRRVLGSMPRTRIVSDRGDYIHAEVRSRFFRFVDDLEFLSDPSDAVIHVRSASRLGYSDMGVNRSRMEAIRSEFDRLTEDESGRAS